MSETNTNEIYSNIVPANIVQGMPVVPTAPTAPAAAPIDKKLIFVGGSGISFICCVIVVIILIIISIIFVFFTKTKKTKTKTTKNKTKKKNSITTLPVTPPVTTPIIIPPITTTPDTITNPVTTPPAVTTPSVTTPNILNNLTEGAAVICTSNPPSHSRYSSLNNIYRYTANKTLRFYPDPSIAGSWDPNWMSPTKIDCKDLTLGEDMTIKVGDVMSIKEGTAVKCYLNPPSNSRYSSLNNVYRYIGNKTLRMYPEPNIAHSWDPTWMSAIGIDCKDVTIGSDMKIIDGAAVKCIANHPTYPGYSVGHKYRYTAANKTLRLYPNPDIAASWDPDWMNAIGIDCKDLIIGDNMNNKNVTIGPNITIGPNMEPLEGTSVKCNSNSLPSNSRYSALHNIYRYIGNKTLRWYPTPEIASSWDPKWNNPLNTVGIDCKDLTIGGDMKIIDGATVKCIANHPTYSSYTPGHKFRYDMANKRIQLYANPDIATSWDPDWMNAIGIDCKDATIGIPIMQIK